MTERSATVNEQELHAYVDGQLKQSRRLEIEEILDRTPAMAARVRDYQRINQALMALERDVLDEVPPRRLRRLAKPRRKLPFLRTAAAVLWLCSGVVIGWWLKAQSPSPQAFFSEILVQDALQAHAVYLPEVRHPVEVPADQEQHLVNWLSKRLNAQVRAPKLSTAGFELLGGRLLPATDGLAAQFMYENSQGQRLTLFVRKDVQNNPETAFQFAAKNQLNAFYWIDRHLGYALIGDVDRSVLTEIANSVYQQLSY